MEISTNKILDASVIIKWFTQEEGSDRAHRYLQEYKENKFSIYVPTLLYYELGNILLAKKATKYQVSEIMKHLQLLHLIKVDVGYDAFRKVFENASELNITFYDAAYVTLMQNHDCEFVTADKKLYEKAGKVYTRITFL